MKCKLTWKIFHKWIGLILTVFILLFCISGIVLNHRREFAGCELDRRLLPSDYSISGYNNGVIRGTICLDSASILLYGNTGVFLADKGLRKVTDFNSGLPKGVDRRNVRSIISDTSKQIWCATQYSLYRLNEARTWIEVPIPDNDSRLTDITLSPDSASIIVLTRSALYQISQNGNSTEATIFEAPENYQPRVTLFKTIWMLHSGELFGTAGRLAVDIIAIIIIVLCITGIMIFICPYAIKRKHKKTTKWLHSNLLWHTKIGYVTIVLTLLVAATGMCLRPPLMIPLVLTKTAPPAGSVLDTPNAWADKLRAIRWDKDNNCWLLSTSEGFATVDYAFTSAPIMLDSDKTAPVSPMGINAFCHQPDGSWLIGSFSGLYRWDHKQGTVCDYFTGEPYMPRRSGFGISTTMVAGISHDIAGSASPVIFDYRTGAPGLPQMSEILAKQPISLWNAALELHVGRCYHPFLGPISELFVFIWGLLTVLILISGLIIHLRITKKHNKSLNKSIKNTTT